MKYGILRRILFTSLAMMLTGLLFHNRQTVLSYTPEEQVSPPKYDVAINGGNKGRKQLQPSDVIAMQISLTADALAISTSLDSYGNNTGCVTIELYSFDTDYDTTLLSAPIAEHTFKDFADGADLSFNYTAQKPLPKGEYILVLYDMNDETPTASGGAAGTGIGIKTKSSHKGQRAYINGVFQEDCTFPVNVKYATSPGELYGSLTVPQISEDVDIAPHMGGSIDFRKEESMDYLGGSNQTSADFVTEDGENFLRLLATPDAGDPYQYIELPDVLVKCNEYKYIVLKVRINESPIRQAQLFFATDEQNVSETSSVRYSYKNNEDWQYIILNLGSLDTYKGQLKGLRLDYFQSCSGNQYIDIQFIALFKNKEGAIKFKGNFEDFKDASQPEENVGAPDYNTYISGDTPADPVEGKLTENGKLNYIYKEYPYIMTFDQSLEAYIAKGGYAFLSIDNGVIKDGKLKCKAFSSFGIYTKNILPDKYGMRDGALEFDMVLEKGEVCVTLRQILPKDDKKYSGLSFKLCADGTLTVSERDGYFDTIQLNIDLSTEHHFAFEDKGQSISLVIDGNPVYTVLWNGEQKTLTSPEGNKSTAIHLPKAGYGMIEVVNTRGYLDNVSYIYTDIIMKTVDADSTVEYSTWEATDDLDRVTPDYSKTGKEKERYVGLFYFLIHSDDTGSRYVNDVTRLYLQGGTEYLSSTLSSFAGRNGAYWAEPYFGYYSSHDTWVYQKHAHMLEAAGVDFIFLDVSNNRFYIEQATVLFDTWKAIRQRGGQTPQIAFMYGDMPFTMLNGLYTLLEPFYNNPDYEELLFCWEGKPLILGNTDTPDMEEWTVSGTTPQDKETYLKMLSGDPGLEAFYQNEYKKLISERFTVRKSWAWQAENYNSYWDWLQESPQAIGTDKEGNPEQISVSMGVHAHTSRGRSYINGNSNYNSEGNFGFTLGTAQYGYFFEEQFEYALTQDVDVVMITGWNEWYAGVNVAGSGNQTCGQTLTPYYYMVDQMSPEYSRDGEPMKIRDGVGFGDNFYYQMVSYIRKFKGIDAAPATVNGGRVKAEEKDFWQKVAPAFNDVVGDIAFRNYNSFTSEFLYINGTARNDLDTAKITQDGDYIYFNITTSLPLITVDDPFWMNLYIDSDNDSSTGWEGFDYVINRSRTDKKVSVEKFADGKWEFILAGEGEYTLDEFSMTVKVAKTVLGYASGEIVSFKFKWADNANVAGDIMKFMELGDSAPDDRFVFVYKGNSLEDRRNIKTEENKDILKYLLIAGAGAGVAAAGTGAAILVKKNKKRHK